MQSKAGLVIHVLACVGGGLLILAGGLLTLLVVNPPVSGNPNGPGWKAWIAATTLGLPLAGTVAGIVKPWAGCVIFAVTGAAVIVTSLMTATAEGESRLGLLLMLLTPIVAVAALFAVAGVLKRRAGAAAVNSQPDVSKA